MRIAVACKGLAVAPQASLCSNFTCYSVTNGVISGCCNVPNMGTTVAECVDTLRAMGINVLIAGTLSPELGTALAAAGIEYLCAVSDVPFEAAQSYLQMTLLGDESLANAAREDGPLDEMDDLFARIEFKLLAQPA